MSVQFYGIYVPCALILTPDVGEIIKQHTGTEAEDIYELCEIFEGKIPIACSGNVSGEGRPLPWTSHDYIDYEDDSIYYIKSNRDPQFFNTAYSSIEELEEEFRQKLKGYVPDDFPVSKYLFSIVGASYD